MTSEFLEQFCGQAFSVGQPLVFKFKDEKVLSLVVKSLEAATLSEINSDKKPKLQKIPMGRCLEDTVVQFEKAQNSSLNLTD